MADSVTFLSYIALIMLVGIVSTIISQKLKISNVLLLLLSGLTLQLFHWIDFPIPFITSVSLLALVMIVFDSASRLELKEFNKFSISVLQLSFVFLLFNLIFLSAIVLFISNEINNLWLALLFSSLMAGTDPGTVLTMFQNQKNRVAQFLEVESIINTPLVVLIPFVILDLMNTFGSISLIESFSNQILPFFAQLAAGVGAGLVLGIIIFGIMKKSYSETISPLAVITAALLAYVGAELIGGNGVISVTVMGMFFGTMYVRQKTRLVEYSSIFTTGLEILVFVLIGIAITLPWDFWFFVESLLLFGWYLGIRALTVWISTRKLDFNWKEKLFMTFSVQKGIAIAVVALTLSTLAIEGIKPVLHLALAFMIYSIVLSTIALKFHKHFFSH